MSNKHTSDDKRPRCEECKCLSNFLDAVIVSAIDGCKTCELVLEKTNALKDKIAEHDYETFKKCGSVKILGQSVDWEY